MFRVALVLIRSMFGKQEQLDECPDLYDTLTILKKIPEEYTTEEYLITEVSESFLNQIEAPVTSAIC